MWLLYTSLVLVNPSPTFSSLSLCSQGLNLATWIILYLCFLIIYMLPDISSNTIISEEVPFNFQTGDKFLLWMDIDFSQMFFSASFDDFFIWLVDSLQSHF